MNTERCRENDAVRGRVKSALSWVVPCVLLLSSIRANAQLSPGPTPPSNQAGDRPWAFGVSEAEQAIANELYVAGNREFTESRFTQALGKYREAIQHWDHPAIRFNMAICLINLDQPLDARDSLERSLKYGVLPLGADLYTQGLTYWKLLDAQLTRVEIECQEPGAEITLDGKLLFIGPGATDEFLLPGEHQVVGTKPGFQTVTETFVGVAGKRTSHRIELTREPRRSPPTVRRWAPWKPWLVVAGSGVLFGLGTLSYVAARDSFATYDQGIDARCPRGCDATRLAGFFDLDRVEERAGTQETIAVILFSTAGAVVIAGVVGVVMNRPRVVSESNQTPIVTPVPGGATASMSWRF